MRRIVLLLALLGFVSAWAQQSLTSKVNPLLGTATLWDKEDLHYERKLKKRTWGAEVFPGASLPNAMVQLSPMTMYKAGAGYQYEDKTIIGFTHTSKGHWNLQHVPILPVSGKINPMDFASEFSHDRESARPGYYSVYLKRYNVEAELTSTLRCAFHRYTYAADSVKRVLFDITMSNNFVHTYSVQKAGEYSFSGSQSGDGKIYFYGVANYPVKSVEMQRGRRHIVAMMDFKEAKGERPLELKIGFSFVSIENAKLNLEQEMLDKSFEQVRDEADRTWEKLLSHIRVEGGTERQQSLFYSTLYRSFLWPALRSDCNGEYLDMKGDVVKADFRYYTNPSFWDDHRNKLPLLEMISPDVALDIIKSCIDKGEKKGGYMPTFFHGDHASTFISGSWLRGIRDFDLERAYRLLKKNAMVPGKGGRPYLDEYIQRGWISEKDTLNVKTDDIMKAGVTKTCEYSYDDYATALVAKELGDMESYSKLMARSKNYRNMFDSRTGFYRGRIEDGSWVKEFRPDYPYYEYQFREATAWQSLFYAPHDPQGMVAMYESKAQIERMADDLFTIPWTGYEAHNFTGFLGQYCHGNQPGHSQPYVYYFIGKQPKSQAIINTLLDKYYDMGRDKLAYAGMDDAGEMSSWYVLNAIGLYTYSPADAEYLVSVPLFDKVTFTYGNGDSFCILKKGNGNCIKSISAGGKPVKGYFISDQTLRRCGQVNIQVR